ncbi:Dps family protein [[Mycoplasma] mobile]|uniref:Neutrophil activating protein bacterioferritin n=1 Tax=Mycoplasma mobile (strain ATCC 43663 / 163K / NCTC 11711) TaxID=267748 RepID=Q6KHA2_MYCM1|nr:DNA starvation/stationary phase protection protein [[Mycoplasma] mobile]AAT28028.1 neutrophil activating protein bacterioferritin [Mycoplasma mobile 163K]
MKNIEKLRKLQASIMVFTNNVYSLHWNVKGSHFFEIHEETEKLFKDLREMYDDVAEKIVMHDALPVGSYKNQLELSAIKEIETKWYDLTFISNNVVESLGKIIELTDAVEGTNVIQPMLDEIYLKADKWRWNFRQLVK